MPDQNKICISVDSDLEDLIPGFFVASRPPITGMLISIRIQSIFLLSLQYKDKASSPFSAVTVP